MKWKICFLLITSIMLTSCSDKRVETVEEITRSNKVEITTTEVTIEKKTVEYAKIKEPYVGMSESGIENTELGKATSIKECTDFFRKDNAHRWREYIWELDGICSVSKCILWEYY